MFTDRRLRGTLTFLLLTSGLIAVSSLADSKLTSDDADFLKKAAKGGITEVELGRMTLKKSSNADVKNFASMIVRDHSKANHELDALAASKGLKLPDSKSLGEDVSATHLKMLSGKSYDDDYLNLMVSDHKEDIADFEKESNSAQDPDVRKWAAKTLPTLREHLQKAEQLQTSR
jgi:putative membrane protein